MSDDEVTVRCSPAAAVTLLLGGARGSRANAGRLGYPNRAEVLERTDDGLITPSGSSARSARRTAGSRSSTPPVGRAWTNPLWTE